METTVRKSFDGWEAKTEYPLTAEDIAHHVSFEGAGAQPVLSVTTGKRSRGGVSSIAMVYFNKDGFQTFTVFGDFTKTVHHDPKARCTEKAVKQLHEQALMALPGIKEQVKAFYAAKAKVAA